MTIFAFFVLPVLLVSANHRFVNQNSEDATSLSIAIESILKKVLIESNRVDIRVYGSNHGLPELDEIMARNKNVPVKVKRCKTEDGDKKNPLHHGSMFDINESAIIIYESFDWFWAMVPYIFLQKNFFKPLKLYVYIKGANVENLNYYAEGFNGFRQSRKQTGDEIVVQQNIPNDMNMIHNYYYFIIDQKRSIKLYTLLWYTQEKCSEPQLFEVNIFNKSTNKWKNTEFEVEKLRNFHGCQLTFARLNFSYSLKLNTSIFSSLNLSYTDTMNELAFISSLSTSLNFTYEIIQIDLLSGGTDSKFSMDKENATVDLYLYEDKTNLFVIHGAAFHMTQPHLFTPVKLLVPPGQPYNAYEKLLLPFDEHAWLLIGLTFIAAFSIVFFFKFFKKTVTNFVFGRNVASPSLNIVMIFCGIAQVVLPRRNFARFLVMMFILYSLIIRTAWQSQMFKFFQKEVIKPEIKSFEEMIEKDFTFYVYPITIKSYGQSDMIKGNKVEVFAAGNFDIDVHMKRIFDHSFRGATAATVGDIQKYSFLTKGKYLDRLNVNLYTEFWTWKLPAFHRFIEIFDKKIQQLVTAGIINYQRDDMIHPDDKRKYEHLYAHLKGPQILTMKQLEAGFVIWLVSVGIAILAFLLEWMTTLGQYLLVRFAMKKIFELKIGQENKELSKCLVNLKRLESA